MLQRHHRLARARHALRHPGGRRRAARARATPGTQLTWMDAKVGDWVVTPRHGKAVEINALWHHALRFVEELGGASTTGRRPRRWRPSSGAASGTPTVGYLNDVVDGEVQEDSLAPPQPDHRGLPPRSPARRRRRRGPWWRRCSATCSRPTACARSPRTTRAIAAGTKATSVARDAAYHQGTVWPWLLGPFITAYLRVEPGPRRRAADRPRLAAAPSRATSERPGSATSPRSSRATRPTAPAVASPRPGASPRSCAAAVEDLGGLDMTAAERVPE